MPWSLKGIPAGAPLNFFDNGFGCPRALPPKKYKTFRPYRDALLNHDPVREFIRAFNERDLDAFVAVLDPEVELHSMKGLRKGRKGARLWATRPLGGVQQTIELDELYEDADKAVALIRRVWHWEEDGSLAGEDEMAWFFELRGRRIWSWRPFEDRAAALGKLR